MKTLFAGPWIGEFGWELFGWQSYLRNISQSFDKIIISSRNSSKYLYQDFCNEYIDFDSSLENTNFHTNSNSNLKLNSLDHISCDRRIISNRLSGKQEFVDYGEKQNTILYDIVFHARNLKIGLKNQRNWQIQYWEKIVEECHKKNYKMCSVGLSEYSDLIPCTEDKRNIDLKTLANLLRNSRLTVGSSSGLIHYATLCKCPQLTWTQREDVKDRYCKTWNPFSIYSNVILSNSPDWKIVLKEINNFIQ